MPKMIFVNLPVTDVMRATAFYQALGFERNATFSNDAASSMVWSDTIHVMLLSHGFYSTFTSKRIIDAKTESGALLCLSFDSREDVDAHVERALKAGARELHNSQDHGFMYGRAFEDLDGHGWESMWMAPEGPAIISEQNAARQPSG